MSAEGVAAPVPIRWGILGTGKIAEDFVNAVCLIPDMRVVSIGSRTQSSADSFASLFPLIALRAHGTLESLVSDPDVDVIYVATPDALHVPHALLALRSGKHVLVEKPFADTAAAAEVVCAEARARGRFVMEALWTRFVPAIEGAMQCVSEGRIGSVQLVSSDFGCQYPIPAGALNALGVYSLALNQMVFEAEARRARADNSNDSASAEGGAVALPVPSQVQAMGTPNTTHLSVQMQYGSQGEQLGTFTASLLVNGPNEAVITGSEGRIKLHGPMWHATHAYTLTRNDGAEEERTVTFPDATPLADYPRPFNLLLSQRLVHEAIEVNRCVRQGLLESPRWTHQHTMHVMRLMDEVRTQLKQQQ